MHSSVCSSREGKAGRPVVFLQVHAHLKKMIESQAIQPGRQLDSEMQLCKRFGVSRPSIRKAIRQLCREKLIVSVPGKGHFVSSRENCPNTGAILCIVGTHNPEAFCNDFYVDEIVTGLRRSLGKSQHRLLLEAIGVSKQPPAQMVSDHIQDLAGIIVVPIGDQTAESMLVSTPSDIPRVVVGRPSHKQAIPCVYIDHRAAMRRAVEYLLDMGHENIALLSIGVSTTGWAGEANVAGYKEALRSAGLDENRLAFNNIPNSPDAPQQAMREVLKEHPDITAMVVDVFQDAGILRELQSMSVKVGKDLSLILIDDTENARHHTPPITVVREPACMMGQIGGDMLLEFMKGPIPTPRRVVLDSELVVRESVCSMHRRRGK
jgi:DNA-binding LacI/PurR family transcriptional regulator